jgi:hypothetical protein
MAKSVTTTRQLASLIFSPPFLSFYTEAERSHIGLFGPMILGIGLEFPHKQMLEHHASRIQNAHDSTLSDSGAPTHGVSSTSSVVKGGILLESSEVSLPCEHSSIQLHPPLTPKTL